MRFLENRTKESKREMDILDAIDEMREMTRADAKVNSDDLLVFLAKRDKEQTMSKDENELFKLAFQKKKQNRLLERQALLKKLNSQPQVDTGYDQDQDTDTEAVNPYTFLFNTEGSNFEELNESKIEQDKGKQKQQPKETKNEDYFELKTKILVKKLKTEEPKDEPINNLFSQKESQEKINNKIEIVNPLCDYSSSEDNSSGEQEESQSDSD